MTRVRLSCHLSVWAVVSAAVFTVLCLLAPSVRADVVYLKNGTSFEGRITEETEDRVVLVTDAGTLHLARRDIDRIERKDFTPVQITRPQPEPQVEPEAKPAPAPTPTPTPGGPPPAPGELKFDALQELELRSINFWLRALLVRKTEGGEATEDHVGYNHTILEPLADETGYQLTIESVLLKYSRQFDSYLALEVTTNRKFGPISYTAEALSGRRDHVKVVGKKEGETLVLTTTTEAGAETRTLKYPTDSCVMDSSLYHLLAGGAPTPGTKRQYKFFDLLGGLVGVEQLEVLKTERIRALGRPFDALLVKTKTFLPESPPMEVQRWVSPPEERGRGGRLLRLELGDGALVYEAATEADATRGVKEMVEALEVHQRLFGAEKKPSEEEAAEEAPVEEQPGEAEPGEEESVEEGLVEESQ